MRTIVALIFAPLLPLSADWPEFRGAGGDGHSQEANLPLAWSESRHVRWKSVIPGRGWSTPVVAGDEIWMTTATDGNRSLRVVAMRAADGVLLKNIEVFRLQDPVPGHEKNSAASPSAILEGERVYVHFGTHGIACVKRTGEIVWRNQDFRYFQVHGPGGSPVLHGDHLIFNADGNDTQFVAALNKNTGRLAWRKPRPSGMAYSTPLVIETAGGPQVVSTGANRAISYDPGTGRELWWVRYDGFSNVPRPVFASGLVYLCTGFYQPRLLAVRVDGTGDVTGTHVAWKFERGVPLTPSPVIAGGALYMVSDNGIATALDAATGKELWRQRLGGTYSASPVFADGKIYFLSEDGQTTVIAATKEFRKLSVNSLEGQFFASIAVASGSLFLRSDRSLYRIDAAMPP